MDPFVFFHYNFIRSATPTESLNWNPMKYGELYRSWSSYAFEGVCLAHLPQIRQYMGLAGMEMHLASRVLKTCDDRENFLLDRRDGIVESVKTFFFADMYTMSESEVNRLQDLKRVLSSELNKKRELRFVAISTYGIADQIPALFENQLDIECLFENLK
jgi:uncharacterized protein